MIARNLICVCGAAAALLAAPALAQTNSRPESVKQDSTKQPTDNRPDAARPDSMNKPGATTAVPAVLPRLEGVWKVEVSMNEGWMKSGMHGEKTNEPFTRPDTDRPAGTQPDRNRDGTPTTTPSNPPAGTQPGDRPRDVNTTDGMKHALAKTFTGYAERRLVLGDNILQETIVVPDMGLDGMKPDSQPNRDLSKLDNVDKAAFRGMSFISFNEPGQNYRIVFMDSKHNDMHIDSGTYDASRSRIVFHGNTANDSTGTSSRTNTQPGTKSDPADFSRVPGRDADMKTTGDSRFGSHGDVRVVLEIIGDDQHQVTMYRVAPGSDLTRPGEPRTGTPAASPSDGVNKDPNSKVADPNKPDTMRSLPANAESIVYRAVYTRATGAEAARFRQLLDNDRALTRANTNDR